MFHEWGRGQRRCSLRTQTYFKLQPEIGLRSQAREDEDEVEEEQLIGQGQRPARIRRPPDNGPLKDVGGQAEAGQGADKETETKIAEEG